MRSGTLSIGPVGTSIVIGNSNATVDISGSRVDISGGTSSMLLAASGVNIESVGNANLTTTMGNIQITGAGGVTIDSTMNDVAITGAPNVNIAASTNINIGGGANIVDISGSGVLIGVGATTLEPLRFVKLSDGSGAYIDMSGGKIDISGDDVSITGSSGSSLNLRGQQIHIGNTNSVVTVPGHLIVDSKVVQDLSATHLDVSGATRLAYDTGNVLIGNSNATVDISGSRVDISGGIFYMLGTSGVNIEGGNNSNFKTTAGEIQITGAGGVTIDSTMNDVAITGADNVHIAASANINIGGGANIVDISGSGVLIGVGATTLEPLRFVKLSDGSGAYIDMSGGKIDINGDDVSITGGPTSITLQSQNINIENQENAMNLSIGPGTGITTDVSLNATGTAFINADGGLFLTSGGPTSIIESGGTLEIKSTTFDITIGATTGATVSTTGEVAVINATNATSTTTGSLQTLGGLGVAQAAYIGTTLDVTGAVTGDSLTDGTATLTGGALTNVSGITFSDPSGSSISKNSFGGNSLDISSNIVYFNGSQVGMGISSGIGNYRLEVEGNDPFHYAARFNSTGSTENSQVYVSGGSDGIAIEGTSNLSNEYSLRCNGGPGGGTSSGTIPLFWVGQDGKVGIGRGNSNLPITPLDVSGATTIRGQLDVSGGSVVTSGDITAAAGIVTTKGIVIDASGITLDGSSNITAAQHLVIFRILPTMVTAGDSI